MKTDIQRQEASLAQQTAVIHKTAASQLRQSSDIQKTIATQATAADIMPQLAQELTNMDT